MSEKMSERTCNKKDYLARSLANRKQLHTSRSSIIGKRNCPFSLRQTKKKQAKLCSTSASQDVQMNQNQVLSVDSTHRPMQTEGSTSSAQNVEMSDGKDSCSDGLEGFDGASSVYQGMEMSHSKVGKEMKSVHCMRLLKHKRKTNILAHTKEGRKYHTSEISVNEFGSGGESYVETLVEGFLDPGNNESFFVNRRFEKVGRRLIPRRDEVADRSCKEINERNDTKLISTDEAGSGLIVECGLNDALMTESKSDVERVIVEERIPNLEETVIDAIMVSTPQMKETRRLARQKQLKSMRAREMAESRNERALRRTGGGDDKKLPLVTGNKQVTWKDNELVRVFNY